MAQTTNKKKLKASLITWILSFLFFGGVIYCLVSMLMQDEMPNIYLYMMIPLGVGELTCWVLSIVFNLLYRKDRATPGALSTTLLVLQLGPTVILYFAVVFLAALSGESQEPVTAKDDDGNEHTLKRTSSGILSEYYKDEDGEEWVSKDGGHTAEKLIKEATIKDDDGNEYHLRAYFAGSSNFIDQNGDKWYTPDGGKTFTRE